MGICMCRHILQNGIPLRAWTCYLPSENIWSKSSYLGWRKFNFIALIVRQFFLRRFRKLCNIASCSSCDFMFIKISSAILHVAAGWKLFWVEVTIQYRMWSNLTLGATPQRLLFNKLPAGRKYSLG